MNVYILSPAVLSPPNLENGNPLTSHLRLHCIIWCRQINVVLVLVKVLLRDRNDVPARHPPVRRLPALLILVVLELQYHLLDPRFVRVADAAGQEVGGRAGRPRRLLRYDRAVEARGLGEDGHHSSALLEPPLRAGAEPHDVVPRQPYQLRGVVLVLHVVGLAVGVEPQHVSEYPRPVLVGPRHLRGHLIALVGRELATLPLAPGGGQGLAVEVGRGTDVFRQELVGRRGEGLHPAGAAAAAAGGGGGRPADAPAGGIAGTGGRLRIVVPPNLETG